MGKITLNKIGLKQWPDLFGEKTRSRTSIESVVGIKVLLMSGKLLTIELNKLLSTVISTSTEVENLIIKAKSQNPVADDIKSELKTYIKLHPEIDLRNSKVVDEIIGNILTELMQKMKSGVYTEIDKQCVSIVDSIEDYRLATGVDLSSILNKDTIHCCVKCGQIVSRGAFRTSKCICGNIVNSSRDTSKVNIEIVDENVKFFFQQNEWLEYGVETLLAKAGYDTECGALVLGMSGVKHEIDVLGENIGLNNRVVVECKNKGIGIDDMFKMYGKMSDIGCNYGLMFTTSRSIHRDVQKIAKAKNIKIYSGILGCDEKGIIDDLRQENII